MSRPSRGLVRSHAAWLRSVGSCARLSGREHVCEARAPDVSGWSVAEQLEHLLLADRSILAGIEVALESLASGAEMKSEGGPSMVGRVILATGIIPRGRGEATRSTTPSGMGSAELARGFVEVRARLESLGGRLAEVQAVQATRSHPLLGHFTPKRWVRFSRIHHNHHAKIIGEILGAQGDGSAVNVDDGGTP